MKLPAAFTPDKKLFFTKNLLQWYAGHHRPLPWKGEKNPYLVWLSEIILQQTRVEQGLPYFEKFKAKYPSVKDLASAPEDEIMKMWEGLGYYSRARNLHEAAKYIEGELNGIFPETYEEIRALKGVGDYTAAAIASFAFNLPHAVVDGNVYRVLSRFFHIAIPVDTSPGKKLFASVAQDLLETAITEGQQSGMPGRYNQAIMDFGATVCTPAPKCASCPLKAGCEAFKQHKTGALPVKSKKTERRQRVFNYLIINQEDAVYLKKRTEKDIWRNLYDFPLIETDILPEHTGMMTENEIWQQWMGQQEYRINQVSAPFRQELSHQRIVAVFWEIGVENTFQPNEKTWIKILRNNLGNFAFPKVIDLYFKQKFLPLKLF